MWAVRSGLAALSIGVAHDDVDGARDRALVARYQAGDPSAFDELYRLYHRRVHRRVLRAVGAANAEDVVQETFLAVWRRLGALDDGEHVYAYLAVTARNLVAARREADPPEPLLGDVGYDQVFRYDELLGQLATLPAGQRAVVERRVLDGLSRKATAQALGLKPGDVDLLLGRALAALRATVSGP